MNAKSKYRKLLKKSEKYLRRIIKLENQVKRVRKKEQEIINMIQFIYPKNNKKGRRKKCAVNQKENWLN